MFNLAPGTQIKTKKAAHQRQTGDREVCESLKSLLTDVHVRLLSRENTGGQARSGERALFGCRTAQLAFCLSAVVPALRRTRHPFAVSGPKAVTED
jgi:hypothetical protein